MSLILSGSDGLSDVDGSASTPAIRGTDANTGMFFPAADTIAFAEGGTEVMRIDSGGRVTMPLQPSCVAYLTTAQSISSATVTKINLNVTGYDTASNFNTSTNRFTAPIAGYYLAMAAVQIDNGGVEVHCGIYLNGGSSASAGLPDTWNQSGLGNTTGSGDTGWKNCILKLNANDYLELYTFQTGATRNCSATRTTLSVRLIG